MSQEFTFYTIFILLTLTMGVIFQFVIAKIKGLEKNQKRMVQSIEKLHREAYSTRKDDKVTSRHNSRSRSFRGGTHTVQPQVLTGQLRLNYQGRSADTRAVFMLDKED